MHARGVGGALLLVASVAWADQVVVTDVTYTHSATTTSDSHYRVDPLPGTPDDWTSPVDYTKGTAVVRLEVFTKPTDTQTRFQICFEATPSYACTDQAPAYTTTGVYTWTTKFTSFYQYSLVDWSQGTRRIALILKDTHNVKPAPENVGPDASALYMPTDLRVTVTLVSENGTYVFDAGAPDAGVPDAGPPDAGAPDAGPADAGALEPEDAGHPQLDAGAEDGGAIDAGVNTVDGGGAGPSTEAGVTGGCSAGAGLWPLLALVLARARRGVRARTPRCR